jgi:hypothetical protein
MSDLTGRCPRCRRPIAIAGPRCLYCGGPLSSVAAPRAVEQAVAGPERTVLVIDTTPGAAALAAALDLTVAEARFRVQRGRLMLYRILAIREAEAEAARLSHHGLAVYCLPEGEVRAGAQPLVARGGDPAGGSFVIGPERAVERVAAGDVLLVVWGPIRRETVEPERGPLRSQRRPSASPVQDAELYHLHVRGRQQPIEIDPWGFRFSENRGRVESSQLRMRTAIEALAGAARIDRSFRHEPPALAPSGGAPDSALEGIENLFQGSRAAGRKGRTTSLLDNVGQFRFHSSWLGAVARRASSVP